MRAAFVCALALLSLSHAQALKERQSKSSLSLTVSTSSGTVNGHAASNATSVSEYLGIPYALPPVGDLRFAAPQKYSGNSTINGTSFGFSCPAATVTTGGITAQSIADANITTAGLAILTTLNQIGDKFSEDCLTLNVWTKSHTDPAEEQKAVLVWIYGGSFTSGNSDNPGYNGQYIVDQEDVIVVSFNYRLNIFGFPGSPATTQNLGLLDQRMAIEWVRDNIAQFGGDPSRITLFGQSAGGESVDLYTYAWTADPIASSFIEESGTFALGLQLTAAAAATSWYSSSSKLGCGDATSSAIEVLACMRAQNSSSLLSSLMDSGPAGDAGFGPTVDNKVVFSDYQALSQSGSFIKRPLLIGNADNEAGVFKAAANLEGRGAQYSDPYWTDFNQAFFTCPAAARANISIAQAMPTWRYRWFGEFPNTRLESVPNSGAWHASELPILFDTAPTGAGIPASTPAEVAIGSYLRGAWAAFAKDPVHGLSNYTGGNGTGWPTYDPVGETLVRLGYQNQTGANLGLGNAYDLCNTTLFNATFVVPDAALAAAGTATTAAGSAAPSATKKSEGGRRGVEARIAVLITLVAFVLL